MNKRKPKKKVYGKRKSAVVVVHEPALRITPAMVRYLQAEAAANITRQAITDEGWGAIPAHGEALVKQDQAWHDCRPHDRYMLGLLTRMCLGPSQPVAAAVPPDYHSAATDQELEDA